MFRVFARGLVMLRQGWVLRALLFLMMLLPSALPAPVLATPIGFLQTPVPEGATGQTATVARVVSGILSYTRWPAEPVPLRLCVAGIPRFADGLTALPARSARRMEVLRITGASVGPEGCKALYLGRLDADERRRLLTSARGQPVVTIDENDPPCRAGAMFCLHVASNSVAFELNLDAVSRSTVRIDPKVLLLSRRGDRS